MTLSLINVEENKLRMISGTHWQSVGSLSFRHNCHYGMILFQGDVDLKVLDRGMDLIHQGKPLQEIKKILQDEDENFASRQGHMRTVKGEELIFSGENCLANVLCEASENWRLLGNTLKTMPQNFKLETGLSNLQFLQSFKNLYEESGDLRGVQSMAFREFDLGGKSLDMVVELRVDWAEDPLKDLEALLQKDIVFRLFNEIISKKNVTKIQELFSHSLCEDEFVFWIGETIDYSEIPSGCRDTIKRVQSSYPWSELKKRIKS